MAVLSILPGIGAALIWIPAVVYLIIEGQPVHAVGLGLWCAIVVGTIDNLLRPLLIGKDTEMPDLLVMLSTLGGLALFGAAGILVGPIIGALYITVWKLWGSAMDVPEDVAEANPYGTLPTLLDRDLALYDSRIICEYLDERFPHPPLLPVDPVSRASSRLYMYRVENDWYGLVGQILAGGKAATKARKEMREGLTAAAPILAHKPFFMSDEYTLVDASIAPLLWRLPMLGVELPPAAAKVIDKYANRLFSRNAFKESLTEEEREMRP